MLKIPIEEAKGLSEKLNLSQVIIVALDSEGYTHVVTYGKSKLECEQAALGGNFVKRALGWPEKMCSDKPERIR